MLDFAATVKSYNLKSDSATSCYKFVPLITNFDYQKRFEALTLTTLAERRLKGDAIQMYKIMHEIDKANRFQVIQTEVSGHSFEYHCEISKNKQRYSFFFRKL